MKEQRVQGGSNLKWFSSNGDTHDEWLRYHGNTPEQWHRVKRKMKALKLLQVAEENGADMTSLLANLEQEVDVRH